MKFRRYFPPRRNRESVPPSSTTSPLLRTKEAGEPYCRITAIPTSSKRPRFARSQGLIGTSSSKPGVTQWKQPMGLRGSLVIRRGYVVGEWYKDCDPTSDFNIYSCSKAYTSTAFGLILTDWRAAEEAGIKPPSLETRVCNAEWIPEALPLSDARKSEITVRHLLNMVSGLGDENPPDPPGGKSPFEPKGKHAFRMVPGSTSKARRWRN